jgi:adenine deaminase
MLCSDDKHPNDLVAGHINLEVRRALKLGLNIMNVLRSCTYNPVKHYNLGIGLLQPGHDADFILVDNMVDFNVLATYVNGQIVAETGRTLITGITETPFNKFNIGPIAPEDIHVAPGKGKIRVFNAFEGQLITGQSLEEPLIADNNVVSDTSRDILKIVVKNRYNEAPASVGFIKNLGFKRGAIASCVAHDSHNIVAVGADDGSIVQAINLIIAEKGGISLVDGPVKHILPLPFAGIMSGLDGYDVAKQYEELDRHTRSMGTSLAAPYMTLSFMALLVIPELKLSDKGLFDGTQFKFTTLFTG